MASQWGLSHDVPVPGDYDGDGRADLAVFRPSTSTWYIASSGGGAPTTQQWGLAGDIPVPGYFDADSAAPTAACPAASRAVSTRNGEQLT